jgi:hypothetical protein
MSNATIIDIIDTAIVEKAYVDTIATIYAIIPDDVYLFEPQVIYVAVMNDKGDMGYSTGTNFVKTIEEAKEREKFLQSISTNKNKNSTNNINLFEELLKYAKETKIKELRLCGFGKANIKEIAGDGVYHIYEISPDEETAHVHWDKIIVITEMNKIIAVDEFLSDAIKEAKEKVIEYKDEIELYKLYEKAMKKLEKE